MYKVTYEYDTISQYWNYEWRYEVKKRSRIEPAAKGNSKSFRNTSLMLVWRVLARQSYVLLIRCVATHTSCLPVILFFTVSELVRTHGYLIAPPCTHQHYPPMEWLGAWRRQGRIPDSWSVGRVFVPRSLHHLEDKVAFLVIACSWTRAVICCLLTLKLHPDTASWLSFIAMLIVTLYLTNCIVLAVHAALLYKPFYPSSYLNRSNFCIWELTGISYILSSLTAVSFETVFFSVFFWSFLWRKLFHNSIKATTLPVSRSLLLSCFYSSCYRSIEVWLLFSATFPLLSLLRSKRKEPISPFACLFSLLAKGSPTFCYTVCFILFDFCLPFCPVLTWKSDSETVWFA